MEKGEFYAAKYDNAIDENLKENPLKDKLDKRDTGEVGSLRASKATDDSENDEIKEDKKVNETQVLEMTQLGNVESNLSNTVNMDQLSIKESKDEVTSFLLGFYFWLESILLSIIRFEFEKFDQSTYAYSNTQKTPVTFSWQVSATVKSESKTGIIDKIKGLVNRKKLKDDVKNVKKDIRILDNGKWLASSLYIYKQFLSLF